MTREEAINKVRQMSLPKETKEILEALAPELRESEDERIRNEIIEFLQSFGETDEWIAWLEKQKECHSDDVLNRTYQEGFEDGFKAGREVERRNSSDNDFIKPRMQEPWNKEKQKEQKPEYPLTPDECIKSAEWRDEDEMYLSQAIETLEHENYLILAEKLKSLRPQQHSWSKEDRNMLDIIISELEQEGKNANVPGLYHLEIDFLKSLKPQPKAEWSEADETYLQYALWCVEKAEKSCKDGEDKGACWSARRWLKSLRSRPKASDNWKPSDK